MKPILATIFFIIVGSNAFSCEINAYSSYILPDNDSDITAKDIIKDSNCNDDILSSFVELIKNTRGLVKNNHIRSLLAEHKTKINVKPGRIRIGRLSESISSKMELKNNWEYNNSEFLYQTRLLALGENEIVSYKCQACDYPGEKNIQISIVNPISSKRQTIWGKTNVLVRTKALVATRSLTPGQKLNPSDFVEKFVLDKNPSAFFTNQSKIIFYQINKPIQEGKAVQFSDLTPVNLVSIGKPVKVIYENDSISLSGTAIPSKGGKFGETIQLRNIKNRKTIIGRVIDFNKVQIEL